MKSYKLENFYNGYIKKNSKIPIKWQNSHLK